MNWSNFINKNIIKMEMKKRGQVAVFVVIGVVIVGAVLLFFLVSDAGKGLISRWSGEEYDVQSDIISCIERNENIDNKISKITKQGGRIEPQNYFSYQGTDIEYLCYTSNYLETCYMQKVFVLGYVEDEIKKAIKEDVEKCADDLKNNLRRRGYDVSSGEMDFDVSIFPDNIEINIDMPLTVRRGDSRNYRNFQVRKSSKLYDLIMITNSILNYEAIYGDSNVQTYMAIYPNIRVEQQKRSEGSTIYLVSDRNTKEEFNFATRSLAWPV